MNYLSEIKKLPADIQDILISPFGAQINREIATKHGLDKTQLGQMMNLTNDIYIKILEINNLPNKIINVLKLAPAKANALALDMAGQKLLIADIYFKGAIKQFIIANQGRLEEYRSIIVKEEEEIKKEQAIYKTETEEKIYEPKYLDLEDSYDEVKLANQEKIDTLALFKEDVKSILTAKPETGEIIKIYNESLIELIKDDNVFRISLEGALYNNQEVLTPGKILLNEDEKNATICNWLKDFISENGSEMFSNVVLVKYLAGSRNIKKLVDNDRNLIKKLLKLYRNLAFFPESMENIPLDEWEIFPIDFPENFQEKSVVNDVLDEKYKEVVLPGTNNSDIEIKDKLDRESKKEITPVLLAPKVLSEVEELESILVKYPAGSFEYKTVKQEINRLKRRK